MLDRVNANVDPFGLNATAGERTAFGTSTQSDLIDTNYNANILTGWEVVGNNEAPPKQWFNGKDYTLSYLLGYIYQDGIALWNTNQKYYIGSLAKGGNGLVYKSKTGTIGTPNTGNNPVSDTVNWEIFNNGGLNVNNYLHIQDQKVSGTEGGASIAGVQTRILNTVLDNTIDGASLASNQITLPAGTYYVKALAQGYQVSRHDLRLYNVTDATTDIQGRVAFTDNTSNINTDAEMSGKITIASPKVFELRHYTQAAIAASGLGRTGTSTSIDIYSDIEIWKVG